MSGLVVVNGCCVIPPAKQTQAVLHPNMMKRAPNQLHYNVLFNYLFLGETHPISDACLLSALFQEVISLGMAWLS